MRLSIRTRLVLPAVAAALGAVVLSAPPASAAPEPTWLCRPGAADNPCEIPLDTTYQSTSGPGTVVTPPREPESERPVDCFYVYPTVTNAVTPNAPRQAAPVIVSIAKYQAAPFSQHCRMFAPVYRQVSLPGIALAPVTSKPAFDDVLAAWKQYLAQDNAGRGFVLIGHSQGTLMLRRLIRDHIDTDPQLRDRLVGAVLMGGNVTVKKGDTIGGDFQHVPLCTAQGQHGCVVAYSTFARPPGLVSFFGRTDPDLASLAFGFTGGRGFEIACTDPAVLSGDSGEFGITVPSEPFAPGPITFGIALSMGFKLPTAETTWVSPPDRYRGGCRTEARASIFRFDPVGPDSKRPPEFPPTWGTHLFDMNLGLEKLTSIVGQQTTAWLADHA